jgi:hypothetical protein
MPHWLAARHKQASPPWTGADIRHRLTNQEFVYGTCCTSTSPKMPDALCKVGVQTVCVGGVIIHDAAACPVHVSHSASGNAALLISHLLIARFGQKTSVNELHSHSQGIAFVMSL